MYKILISALIVSSGTTFAQENLETTFELSNGSRTSTYEETVRYYHAIAASSPYVKITEEGLTDSGEPLQLVVLDVSQQFDFEKAQEQGKTVVLINNGIHPGEPDGIEASKMLIRDYAVSSEKRALLKDMVLAVIPTYNIGGALNRNKFSRANQVGPEEYGFRGNARNYDLNRDFIKADTRNTRSFYEIFHKVKPHIFIDTHVSNGADYQYSITHLATQHNKLGGDYGEYLENKFTPELERKMKEKDTEITPYVNVFNSTPDASGFSQFLDNPRYSTGYTTLFHTLGFMIETHMLKAFDQRVKATYNFLESMLELAKTDGENIKALMNERENYFVPGNLHAVSWKLSKTDPRQLEFKGYEGQQQESKVTGQMRLFYDHDKPFTKELPYYNNFVPDAEVKIPVAYIIPQGWHEVITRLKLNDVAYQFIKQDTSISVETYRIVKYSTSSSPYEGHYPHNDVTVEKDKKLIEFRKGDYIFIVNQPAGRFLIETLEPEATDSYFRWNFFDTILQQKEHFSPYVFEEIAFELLEEDPELKAAFVQKKKESKEFDQNWYAQLDYIYKNSPYYEKAHLQYPVYRLVD